jgi:hypothetical protein
MIGSHVSPSLKCKKKNILLLMASLLLVAVFVVIIPYVILRNAIS